MNQVNRAMDRRGDSALRRVQDRGGTGRINSHSREPPKGPRSQGARNMANANRMANMSVAGMPGGPMGFPGMDMSAQASAANMFAQFGQWAEQMSKMPPEMQAQFFANQGMGQNMGQGMGQFGGQFGPGFSNGHGQGQGQGRGRGRGGKSLFDRVERQGQKQNGFNQKKNNSNGQDTEMGDLSAANGEGMDTEASNKDPFDIVCRFNKTCQKPDCPYAHQTPAASFHVTIDLNDTCTHGVACKNFKCVARHPSPAKIAEHHAQENCKYWPNCTNPHCTFRHGMPPCRNGADCTVADCKFTHLKTPCKFNPCLNPKCPFKHAEGQERGKFSDKVWTADGTDKSHVSDRKFVADEQQPEELIIPGKEQAQEEAPAAEAVAMS
jgi:nuclear polyadenylated RNA-binding protein NAB2